MRIAVTGGIACGKSLAGRILMEKGHDVIDADEIARDVMKPGTACLRDIKRCFGGGVFTASGEVDRTALGRLVMGDLEMRQKLNAIVHPPVIVKWENWLKERESRRGLAVVIVPLLYEVGAGAGWDSVICVYASRAVQVARLVERGISPEEAVKWLSAQMQLSEKMKRADYVVCNNGSIGVFRQQIDNVEEMIMER